MLHPADIKAYSLESCRRRNDDDVAVVEAQDLNIPYLIVFVGQGVDYRPVADEVAVVIRAFLLGPLVIHLVARVNRNVAPFAAENLVSSVLIITTFAALKGVVAGATCQQVVAFPPPENVIAAVSIQRIVPDAAQEGVVVGQAEKPVVAWATVDGVVAGPADQGVVAHGS